jgi:cyclopropane-fatty-acyl-phospholipid synthase
MLVWEGHEPPAGVLLMASSIAATERPRNAERPASLRHRPSAVERFLDEDMQYSCAYWRDGVTSLEEAQLDKKRYIAAKLLLRPGMKVLDIGSGWGGMALYLAREHGVEVTGVTLSLDQYQTSVRRAQEAGLSDRVTFKLQDYRHETGSYDRIVSVGMFEHVGVRGFAEYFAHLDRLLKPDGVALLHTIGRMTTPGPINAWVLKYIFPGAICQASRARAIIDSGAVACRFRNAAHPLCQDAGGMGRTPRRRAEVAACSTSVCRMWEFYLQVCELSFRYRPLAVFR